MRTGHRYRMQTRDWLLRQMPKHSVCAEIGVYKGDFSARIISVVQPSTLHLIDPWRYVPDRECWYGGTQGVSQSNMDAIHATVLERFRDEMATGQVCVHRACSPDVSVEFPAEYFDWIYIDGDHRYESVLGDLEAFLPKVKSGGFIVGDDYGYGGWWQGGVKRAVDEFIAGGMVDVIQIKKRQFHLRKR